MKCPRCDTNNIGIDTKYYDKIIEFIICKKCGMPYSWDATMYRKLTYEDMNGRMR